MCRHGFKVSRLLSCSQVISEICEFLLLGSPHDLFLLELYWHGCGQMIAFHLLRHGF